jgi:hypothetical protein
VIDMFKRARQKELKLMANEVQFEGDHPDRLIRTVARQQLKYSMAGLWVGIVFAMLGAVLLILGVGGRVSWTMEFLGASSKVGDAAPGVVLMIAGFWMVFVTRYSVRSKR